MRLLYQILRYLHPSIDKILGIVHCKESELPEKLAQIHGAPLDVTVKHADGHTTLERIGTAYMVRNPKKEVAEGIARQERNEIFMKRQIERDEKEAQEKEVKERREKKLRSLHLLKELREQDRVPK